MAQGTIGTMLPIRSFDELFHVGSFAPADKGSYANSHEGNGLSVSLHPEEWTAIARLGGQPTWRITRADDEPFRMLDAHQLNQGQKNLIQHWAVDAGLVELATRWRFSWEDGETGTERYLLCATQREAQAEAGFLDEERDPSDPASPVPFAVQVLVPTAAMSARTGFLPEDLQTFGIVTCFWVEDVAKLDGVWSEFELDPVALSAPLGVLTLSALEQVSKAVVLQPETRPRYRYA